jgi:pyruvate dehydrogenase E2 component (dihydrolipoamide acetyltransferase)
MGDAADLLMPKLGLTMTEGTVARWLIAAGERFGAGDIVVVIETDKIANDVEAPASGEMMAHLSSEGDVVPVGTAIARWRLDSESSADRATSSVAPQRAAVEEADTAPPEPISPVVARSSKGRTIATPYARRLAREAALDLERIVGSGPRGRIKAADVLRTKEAHAPGVQLAQTHPNLESARRSDVPTTLASFVSIDVNVSALRAIDARLSAMRDRPFERLAYIALACTKALLGDGDGHVRLGFESNGVLTAIECSARETLTAIAARSEHGETDVGSGDIAISLVEGRVRLLAPAPRHGWRIALGVGGVRTTHGGDATHEMTLTMTYDTTTMDHTSAARLLERIASLLEEPLHLLAI